MIEGTEAFTRFKTALKAVLTVPKSAMPPSPFNPYAAKKKPASKGASSSSSGASGGRLPSQLRSLCKSTPFPVT
jgi:hypothetical protein